MSLLAVLLLAAAPGTSLERLAADVTHTVSAAGFEGPVGVYVEGGPAPINRAAGSLVMASLAALQLAPVPVIASDATDAEQRAREQGLRSLLRLTVSLEAPKLVIRGDALSTWVNFWSGSVPTRTGPAAAIASSVDADLEALTLAGAPAPPSTRPLELNLGVLARTAGLPAAMTLADVDGDHRAELIALVADTLVTWSSDGRVRSRVELGGALSTKPTREPFGLLSFANGRLVAWSSRRERAEVFTWQREGWRSTGGSEGLSVGPVTVTPRAGYSSFGRELSWAGKIVVWPEPVEQLAVFGTLALGVGPTGNAALARGQAPSTQVTGVGCGSTLADFDGDGTAEVVVTTARSTTDTDEVRVVSLGAFESTQARGGHVNEAAVAWQKKLEGRVILAASGDLDGDGFDEVVLGTWLNDTSAEFLVLRKSP